MSWAERGPARVGAHSFSFKGPSRLCAVGRGVGVLLGFAGLVAGGCSAAARATEALWGLSGSSNRGMCATDG